MPRHLEKREIDFDAIFLHDPEGVSVCVAAAQYSQFKEQAVREGKVFTFTSEGEYLVYPVHGREVIPFWSTCRRMETIQRRFPKYQAYEIAEMSLAEFVGWLPQLAQDQIHIGTNWSGKRLVGYDVPAQELLAGLEYWMRRDDEGGVFGKRL